MPGMDGLEATRLIREIGTDYAKTLPIIALTANAVVGNEEMFLSKGFQAFVSKPIEIARLDAVIRQWIRNKDKENLYFERQDSINGPPPAIAQGEEEKHPVSGRRSGVDSHALSLGVTGLEVEKGIERFGGDESNYFEVLRSFISNIPPLLESTREVSKDTLADYAIIVHGIKGSSRGIYANMLADMAEALEKEAKAGNYDYVAAHNPAFQETARKLISEANDILAQADMNAPKPVKDKPDKEALDMLLEACRNYDMDGADSAIKEIGCYTYSNDGGLAVWLQENVKRTNFPQIVKRLSTPDI